MEMRETAHQPAPCEALEILLLNPWMYEDPTILRPFEWTTTSKMTCHDVF